MPSTCNRYSAVSTAFDTSIVKINSVPQGIEMLGNKYMAMADKIGLNIRQLAPVPPPDQVTNLLGV
jgi:hypothetical protein